MSTYNAIKYDFTPPAGTFGAMTLISEQTASASASISFTSGIDSTYRTYYFKFIDIHPSADGVEFLFNFSTDGGSNYNVTKTSTAFNAQHAEADGGTALGYQTSQDLAQSTSYENFSNNWGNDNDQSGVAYLWLFNPSSTTYVKHYMTESHNYAHIDYVWHWFNAGYANTTSAINAIDFKMSGGNIDDGIIQMYGIA